MHQLHRLFLMLRNVHSTRIHYTCVLLLEVYFVCSFFSKIHLRMQISAAYLITISRIGYNTFKYKTNSICSYTFISLQRLNFAVASQPYLWKISPPVSEVESSRHENLCSWRTWSERKKLMLKKTLKNLKLTFSEDRVFGEHNLLHLYFPKPMFFKAKSETEFRKNRVS